MLMNVNIGKGEEVEIRRLKKVVAAYFHRVSLFVLRKLLVLLFGRYFIMILHFSVLIIYHDDLLTNHGSVKPARNHIFMSV